MGSFLCTSLILVGWVFLGLLVAYGLRIHRFIVWPEQDPGVAAAIAVYSLDGEPEKRVVPEWEPAKGLLVAYPFRLPGAMLREVAKDTPLYIVTKNERKMEKCLRFLEKKSIRTDRVEFIYSQHGTGHQFTRDWGPLTLQDHGEQALFDAIYLDYPISGYDSSSTTLSRTSDLLPFSNYWRDGSRGGIIARSMARSR